MTMPNESNSKADRSATCSAYVSELISKWCECAPYGEQVPEDLPRLFREFAVKHGHRSEEEMWYAFMSVSVDDPMNRLFECIFAAAARFTIDRLADAVYNADKKALGVIDLCQIGTLSTPDNDPYPECPEQHIMHPNCGGFAVFAKEGATALRPITQNTPSPTPDSTDSPK